MPDLEKIVKKTFKDILVEDRGWDPKAAEAIVRFLEYWGGALASQSAASMVHDLMRTYEEIGSMYHPG